MLYANVLEGVYIQHPTYLMEKPVEQDEQEQGAEDNADKRGPQLRAFERKVAQR